VTSAPKVTVLIPVHNRADYVGEAIASVLAQTFTDFELLVIDDGSTDGSAEVVAGFSDRRVRLVHNATNLGGAKIRNLGLAQARGTYTAMLDSDDRALPRRLGRQVAFLDGQPACALVGGNKRPLGGRRRLGQGLKRRPLAPAEVDARLLFRNCIAHASIMARTAILRDYGYDEDFPVAQDFELFGRLAKTHAIANLPDVLVRYRRHSGQASRRREEVAERQLVILDRQLARLGLGYTSDDLYRHLLLARPRSWHQPDADDVAWSEAWLARLSEANRRVGRYDQNALAAAVGEVWLELLATATPRIGLAALRRLWRSPLKAAASAALSARWSSAQAG